MNEDDLLNDRYRPPGRVAQTGYEFSLNGDLQRYRVENACKSTRGRWVCVSHSVVPNYQEDAEEHASPTCLWVWNCYRHLAETTSARGRRKDAAILLSSSS